MKTLITTFLVTLNLTLFSQIFDYKQNTKIESDETYYFHAIGSMYSDNIILPKLAQFTKIFKVEVVIDERYVVLSSNELTPEGYIDLKKLNCLNYGEHHIYFTTIPMRLEGKKIQGFRRNGNIVVNDLDKRMTTLYHEFAHTCGVRHCDDRNCIMFISETGATWFCNKCENLIKDKLK